MRRSSRRAICQPAAVSGDEVAARAGGAQSLRLARSLRDGIARRPQGGLAPAQGNSKVNEEDEFEDH